MLWLRRAFQCIMRWQFHTTITSRAAINLPLQGGGGKCIQRSNLQGTSGLRCCQRTCWQDIPLRKDTWLEGSRLSYRQIILFIYCWSKELTSKRFCESELEMSKECVVDWNNYLREVCADTLIKNPFVVGGQNKTGEIVYSVCLLDGRTLLIVSYQNSGCLAVFVGKQRIANIPGGNYNHLTVNHSLNFVDPNLGL